MCLKLVSSSVTLDQEGGVVLVLLCCAHLLNTDHPVQINKPEGGREGRGKSGERITEKERRMGRREGEGKRERERDGEERGIERDGEERGINIKVGSKTSSFESKGSPEVLQQLPLN